MVAMNGPRVLRGVTVLVVLLVGLALGGSASAGSRTLRMVPLVEHWDGSSWTQVQVAPAGAQLVQLNAVVAPSPTDVWAFGYTHYAQHWDGTSWTRVALPVPKGAQSPEFNGAAAISPNDIWAVGDAELHGSTYASHAIVDHWNGHRWRVVSEPAVGSLLAPLRRHRPLPERRLGGRRRRCRHREARHGAHADRPLERQGVEAGAEPEPRDAVHAGRFDRRLPRRSRRNLLRTTCGRSASTTAARRTASTRFTPSCSTGTARAGRRCPVPTRPARGTGASSTA